MGRAPAKLPSRNTQDRALSIGTFVGEKLQRFPNSGVETGDRQIRRNLGQRSQHEPPLGQAWMGQSEISCPQNQAVDQQQIQVQGAGTFGSVQVAVAAVASLQSKEEVEQRPRFQICLHLCDCVYEGGLGFQADRLRTIKMRMRRDLPGSAQLIEGGAQRVSGVAGRRRQIGSQSDVCAMPHTATVTDSTAAGRYAQNR
jgi:hypothetical protein